MPKPIAVLVSDLHLSEKAPIARSAEPNWFEAMEYALEQLRDLAIKYDVPVLCGGDIFDRADPAPRVINFAIEHLPKMFAVPGQHDLKFHNFSDLDDTAFGVLEKTRRVTLLTEEPLALPGCWVWGWPWGVEIEPQTPSNDNLLQIAVVHAYVWRKDSGYPGAPEHARVGVFKDSLKGYDVALFGDNHKGFTASLYYEHEKRTRRTLVWNNGGFMRRKIDEVAYMPRMGLLMSDGNVEVHHLDVAHDKFIEREKVLLEAEASHTMQAFLKELRVGGDEPLDFRDSLRRYFDKYEVTKGAQKIILESLSP